jgi:hypothetical protein
MFPRMAKFWASTKLKVNVQKTNNPNTRLHCTKPKSLGKKRYLDKLWNLSTLTPWQLLIIYILLITT